MHTENKRLQYINYILPQVLIILGMFLFMLLIYLSICRKKCQTKVFMNIFLTNTDME